MSVAALGYIVVRAFLFRNRQRQKALRKKQGLRAELRRQL